MGEKTDEETRLIDEAQQRIRDATAMLEAVHRYGPRMVPQCGRYEGPHLFVPLRGDEITEIEVRVYPGTRLGGLKVDAPGLDGSQMPPELYNAILDWVRAESMKEGSG